MVITVRSIRIYEFLDTFFRIFKIVIVLLIRKVIRNCDIRYLDERFF